MKVKLMMGFGQVISFFPVTFDGVAWPKVTIGMMNWLEFFSMPWSVFSAFGFETCDLQQGFLPKFRQHVALVYGMMMLLGLIWFVADRTARDNTTACFKENEKRKKNLCHRRKYTRESVNTLVFTLGSLCLYTVYVGVCTRIFRLFKCIPIGPPGNRTWYLTSDYSVTCYEGEWQSASTIAYLLGPPIVIGIPLAQFWVLHRNRDVLDGKKCSEAPESITIPSSKKTFPLREELMKQHQRVLTKYGSIFKDCKLLQWFCETPVPCLCVCG